MFIPVDLEVYRVLGSRNMSCYEQRSLPLVYNLASFLALINNRGLEEIKRCGEGEEEKEWFAGMAFLTNA